MIINFNISLLLNKKLILKLILINIKIMEMKNFINFSDFIKIHTEIHADIMIIYSQ